MSIAVYIHVPYCLTKCGYCSFFSVPYSKYEIENYFQYLKKEIAMYLNKEYFTADTIYFGGGTPSLLPADYIREIIGLFDTEPKAEITLEVNPVQLTDAFLMALKTTGVNRLSLGVQSMHDKNLQMLGRKHQAGSMADRVKLCRKHGFTNFSVDFMYGLPGISIDEVKADLIELIKLKPKHISTYLLSLDADVPLAHWINTLPDDEIAADQYTMICSTLKEHGFTQYEISNFAKPRFRSKHNLHYWLGNNYLGFGPDASSCIRGYRFSNHDDIDSWEFDIDEGEISINRAQVDSSARKTEFIIMQMRLTRGLDRYEYRRRFDYDILAEYSGVIGKYMGMGFLELKGRYLRFTNQALFVSNHILSEFV